MAATTISIDSGILEGLKQYRGAGKNYSEVLRLLMLSTSPEQALAIRRRMQEINIDIDEGRRPVPESFWREMKRRSKEPSLSAEEVDRRLGL
ncbi:MAG: hypothetical protein KGJ23_08280 [Euryarchaeota archaeon]|nr:hypothetical protein [Euryarchaeota archaeon]MDE1836599.1 hypothetical protein [Euryarchaeota archaeon]MDE1879206.1 hypothetical protein [Euryarchaeota archaeon]MDE2044569.1 hypothetical protein [Thermoplasmata archaeon]